MAQDGLRLSFHLIKVFELKYDIKLIPQESNFVPLWLRVIAREGVYLLSQVLNDFIDPVHEWYNKPFQLLS